MSLEISGCLKCLCTNNTFVQPFIGMGNLVSLKTAAISELPVTHIASIQCVTCVVGINVSGKNTGYWEKFHLVELKRTNKISSKQPKSYLAYF